MKIETRPLTTSQSQRPCDSTFFLESHACLCFGKLVVNGRRGRAIASFIAPSAQFLHFSPSFWARNGLWLWPKIRNWVCNRWLRPRQRTARTYQRLQTISSSIFSGQRPEKMLSRAKARDKEEEIPRKPPLASACRPTRKTTRDFLQIASLSWARGGFLGSKENSPSGEEEENLCAEPSLEHVFFFFSLDGLVTLWLSRARVCLEAVTKPRDRDEISFVESRPRVPRL